jgi:hypothetical protein
MKTTPSRLLVLSILATCTLLISVTSCKKSTDSGTPKFSATIGGTPYNSSYTYAYYFTPQSLIFIEGLEVKSGDSIFLELVVPDSANVHSKLSLNEAQITYLNYRGTFDYIGYRAPSHGTITFSNWDKTGKKIAGNFSGVIYSLSKTDSVVVTNGQFNADYNQ